MDETIYNVKTVTYTVTKLQRIIIQLQFFSVLVSLSSLFRVYGANFTVLVLHC